MTSTTSTPKVSVIIASYNHARFLKQTLDSVLAQTYRDFEVIVVDDASTDDSLEILRHYEQENSCVRVLTHSDGKNKGVSASANLAISHATGQYFAFIGSDDAWYPELLECQTARMEQNSDLGFVYSRIHFMDEAGSIHTNHAESWIFGGPAGIDISQFACPLRRLLQGNFIPALTVVCRRESLRSAEAFDETLIYSDWELWLRIAGSWEISFTDKALALYRVHGNNLSVGIDPKKNLARNASVLQSLSLKAPQLGGRFVDRSLQAEINLRLPPLVFHTNQELAEAHLKQALECDPTLLNDQQRLLLWIACSQHIMSSAEYWQFRVWALDYLCKIGHSAYVNRLNLAIIMSEATSLLEAGNAQQARKCILIGLLHPLLWLHLMDGKQVIKQSFCDNFVLKQAIRLKQMVRRLKYMVRRTGEQDQFNQSLGQGGS